MAERIDDITGLFDDYRASTKDRPAGATEPVET
jgi:hypothetical protein